MIEQLYEGWTPAKQPEPLAVKRVSITGELIALAEKQAMLETERENLKQSVRAATDLLAPLRLQMQEVVACMKKFHEMENEYVQLSAQAHSDIASDMSAIGKEIEQTKELLQEGTRLAASGLKIEPIQESFGLATEHKKHVESEITNTVAANIIPDADKFWEAVSDACKKSEVTLGENENIVKILLSRKQAMLHPDLNAEVAAKIFDGISEALCITLHEHSDGTYSLEAANTDINGNLPTPMPTILHGLGMADKERLMDMLEACETRAAVEQAKNAPTQENLDGLLAELGEAGY